MSKILCAPIMGFASMSREIANLQTRNSYTLDSRGCTLVSDSDDIAFFKSLGFVDFTVQSIVGSSTDGNFLNLITHFGAVGDGATNDGPAFVAGVASSMPLFIPPGTYLIGNSIGVPPTGKEIYGIPGRTILSKTATGTSYITPTFNIEDVTDVTIEGLVCSASGSVRNYAFIIRATTLAQTKRIRIRSCTLSNMPVFIQRYVDTVWIENNSFLGGGANGALNGISIGGTLNPTTGAGHPNAAEVAAGPPTPADGLVQNIWISKNYFYQIRQEAIDVNWQADNVVIDDNLIIDSGMDGSANEAIDCGGNTGQGICHNINITNNRIVLTDSGTSSTNGIHIKGATDQCLVSGNRIESTTSLAATAISGILVGNSCTDVKVIGNTTIGFNDGIHLSVDQAFIADNVARGAGRIGISLFGKHLTVIGNQAYNNSQSVANQYGFNIGAGCDYAIIEGNKSFDTQGTPTQNGFIFAASDRVIYNGNIAYPVKATAESGTGNLTNSLVGAAGNIIA